MKRTWTSEELLEHFTLLPGELAAVGNKSGPTRLGFAVLLKCLQYEGRFPYSRQEVAPEVVRFLAAQVGVDAALFAQYLWEGRTIEAHRAQIREMTRLRECRGVDKDALLDWLCAEILAHEQHPERLRELIRAECRVRGIEVPAETAALIDRGLLAYEAQIYTVIAVRLTPEVQQRLDALLVAAPEASGEREHFRLAAERSHQEGDHPRAHGYMIVASKLRSHIFRATGATFLAAAGMPVVKLALLLGHTDPSTTQCYYLAAEQMALSEAVQQICQSIMETLTSDASVPSQQPFAPADGLGWYRRRGLLPETEGKR